MTNTVLKPSVASQLFSEYQTKVELQKTFGRGETYISAIVKDLERYNEDHPDTYDSISLFSIITGSSRVYYNVFAINHFIANKMKLESGNEIVYDERKERERFHELVDIQRKMFMSAQEYNAMKGGM